MAWFGKNDKKNKDPKKSDDSEKINRKEEAKEETKKEAKKEEAKKNGAPSDENDELDENVYVEDGAEDDENGEKKSGKSQNAKKTFSLIPKYYPCPNCGGSDQFKEYKAEGVKFFKCGYCGGEFKEQSVLDDLDSLESAIREATGRVIEEADYKRLSGYRRRLYDAVSAEDDFDRGEITAAASDVLRIKPNDIAALFYREVATRNDEISPVRNLLRDPNGNLMKLRGNLESLIKFMTSEAVFHREYQHELLMLIEKAYKFNDPERYVALNRLVEKAVANVDSGIFDCTQKRDVYVSCAETDLDKAMQLVEYLEKQEGLSCFIAYRNISKALTDPTREKFQAIDNCKVFLLVSTPDSCSPGSEFYNNERVYIVDEDKNAAYEDDRAYARQDYINIPTAYKKPRIEYRPTRDFIDGHRNNNIAEFFAGFDVVSYTECGEVVAKMLLNAAEKIKRQIRELRKKSAIRCCRTCGKRLNFNENACCEPYEVKEFDTLDEYYEFKQVVDREIAERKKKEEEARERARLEAEREAKRREEQNQKLQTELRNAQIQNEVANRVANEQRIEQIKSNNNASSKYDPHYAEKIDRAFKQFMGGDFKGAAAGAEEVLRNISDHVPMQYIVAFYASFVENSYRRDAIAKFFVSVKGRALLKEDVKLMKNMLLLSGVRIRSFESDALELLMGSEGSVTGAVGFAERFCPKIIAVRESSDYLNDRMITLYRLLVGAGAVQICAALLNSIRKNPDSPYVTGSFHLKTKTERFYNEYVLPIGMLIENIADPNVRDQYRAAFIKEDSAYRAMRG